MATLRECADVLGHIAARTGPLEHAYADETASALLEGLQSMLGFLTEHCESGLSDQQRVALDAMRARSATLLAEARAAVSAPNSMNQRALVREAGAWMAAIRESGPPLGWQPESEVVDPKKACS